MDNANLKRFRALLIEDRSRILTNAASTLKNEIEISKDDMTDDNDLASALSGQNLALRLRDRERGLLRKINGALKRIDSGEYGYCDVCGDEISDRRLEARPVTTMCYECKETSELEERSFASPTWDERTRANPPAPQQRRPATPAAARSASVEDLDAAAGMAPPSPIAEQP